MRLTSAMLLFVLLGAPFAGAAQTATAPVIEVVPESLPLGLDRRGTVTVVLRNTTNHALRHVLLSWFSNEGLTAEGTGLSVAQLAPDAVYSWTLRVTRPPGAPLGGSLYLATEFEWQRDNTSAAVRAISMRRLAVQVPAAESADGWASVQLLTSLTTLQERHPGKIYIVLTNKTADSLRVVRVTTYQPSFVTAVLSDSASAAAPLPPGATRTFTVDVAAGRAVQAGKHLLVFEIELARERPGTPRRATLVTSREVDVGVFGESELLTLLGVPSFLVLPGFLIVATLGLLWTYLGIRNPAGEVPPFPFKTKDADFWLVAVTLSLLGALIYPLFAGRSYLDGYGMRDITAVWFASVGLAIAGFTVVTVAWRLVLRSRARHETLLVPAVSDDQFVTLDKLTRRGMGLNLRQADVTIGGQVERGFLLEPDYSSGDGLWVTPGITVSARKGAPADVLTEHESLLNAGNAAAVAKFLRSDNGRRWLEVGWKPRGNFTRPMRAPRDKVSLVAGPPTSIIEAS